MAEAAPSVATDNTNKALLVHGVLALTLDIRGGKLSDEQVSQLHHALDAVLAGSEPEFTLAVACWLRDKRELGNRLIPIHILAHCARHEASHLCVRRVAPKILLIPSDITEAFGLSRISGQPLPHCLKKAGKDLVESISEFQAAKYDSRSKAKRLKGIVHRCDAAIAQKAPEIPGSSGRGGNARTEQSLRSLEKRREEALEKLKKLKSGDLQTLVRTCHAGRPNKLMMQILQKRYPCSEDDFGVAGLPGTYDESRADERMRLQPPETWEREVSKRGNVPPTWRALLVAEPSALGMTALLRNLRNILQMGFSLPFLEKYVFRKIQGGGGQTPVTLAQTLQQIKSDFAPEQLERIRDEASEHKINIMAYHRILKWLRTGKGAVADGSGLGNFGRIAEELISGFLGHDLAESIGLARVGGCFLKREDVTVRGGQTKMSRERCVPFHPPDEKVLQALGAAFLRGIERACEQQVPAIPGVAQRAVLWLDLAPPPLAAGAAALGLAPEETHLCGLKGVSVPAVPSGAQVPLEQIIASPLMNFELQYVCPTFIDYNLHAYDRNGRTLWTSSWMDCHPGGEKRNQAGDLLAVHCRDICSGTVDCPALRTMHVDLSKMEPEVFALCMSSQCYTGMMPEFASVCLREVPAADRARVEALKGGWQPTEELRGTPVLAASLTTALRSGAKGNGGTCTYAMIYRDMKKGGSKWLFRNLMNECLQSGTFVAVEIDKVMSRIFKETVNAEAVLTCKDPDIPAYLRVCQAARAFKKGGGSAQCFVTGCSWATGQTQAVEVPLADGILENIAAVQTARNSFQDRAVSAGDALLAISKATNSSSSPSVLVRFGNHPELPAAAAVAAFGAEVGLCALDMRGELAKRRELCVGDPGSGGVCWLPGHTEGALRMLCAALENGRKESSSCLLDYVRAFLPATKADGVSEGAAGSSHFQPAPRSASEHPALTEAEAKAEKAAA
jgi:hypothetical protein